MTEADPPENVDVVVTLQELVQMRMKQLGVGYAELARRTDGRPTRGRWQQLGTGVGMTQFPDADTIARVAGALEIDVTTVVLACARSVGLDVRRTGSELAHLIPAGTDRISERLRDAILAVVRAAVADSLSTDTDSNEYDRLPSSIGAVEWAKRDAPSRRGATDRARRQDGPG